MIKGNITFRGVFYGYRISFDAGYVAINDLEGEEVYFVQGDDAVPLLDMHVEEIMEYLHSAGVIS